MKEITAGIWGGATFFILKTLLILTLFKYTTIFQDPTVVDLQNRIEKLEKV